MECHSFCYFEGDLRKFCLLSPKYFLSKWWGTLFGLICTQSRHVWKMLRNMSPGFTALACAAPRFFNNQKIWTLKRCKNQYDSVGMSNSQNHIWATSQTQNLIFVYVQEVWAVFLNGILPRVYMFSWSKCSFACFSRCIWQNYSVAQFQGMKCSGGGFRRKCTLGSLYCSAGQTTPITSSCNSSLYKNMPLPHPNTWKLVLFCIRFTYMLLFE